MLFFDRAKSSLDLIDGLFGCNIVHLVVPSDAINTLLSVISSTGGCRNCTAFLEISNVSVRYIDENRMNIFQCNSTFIAKKHFHQTMLNIHLVVYLKYSGQIKILPQINMIKLVIGLTCHYSCCRCKSTNHFFCAGAHKC